MESSRENNKTRSVFDVHVSKKGKLQSLWSRLVGSKTVNLKPKFRTKHPLATAVLVAVLVFFALVGFQRLFVRAEVEDFYPATCLGTWQGVENAKEKPEMLTPPSTSTTFNDNNSATFFSGTGQIFCGGFLPTDYDAKGEIKNVGLTFVWQIGKPSETSTFPQGATITTSTEETSTIPETSPTSFLLNVAFAQTSDVPSSETLPPSDTTPATDVPPEPPVIVAPPIEATLTPPSDTAPGSASATDASATSPSAPATPPPPTPDENFLKISYSTDGQTWIEIAKVNQNNWQNFTVTLPVADWDAMKKLQIQVEGIPTTQNPTPKVYLDGMFAEVHYDLPPVLSGLIGGAGNGTSSPEDQTAAGEQPTIVGLPPSQKPVPANPEQNSFRADEAPQFNFDLGSISSTPAQ